jgi:RNA polymerase sigma-70 factor (ECF subfamily)
MQLFSEWLQDRQSKELFLEHLDEAKTKELFQLAKETGDYNELLDFIDPQIKSYIYGQLAASGPVDDHEVEDIKQDVLTHVWQNLDKIIHPDKFIGWLFKVATNTVKMHQRAGARRPMQYIGSAKPDDEEGVSLDVLASTPAGQETEEREWVLKNITKIEKALSALKPKQRRAFEDFYLHGMSMQDIADKEDIPRNTAKRRVMIARDNIKNLLEMD